MSHRGRGRVAGVLIVLLCFLVTIKIHRRQLSNLPQPVRTPIEPSIQPVKPGNVNLVVASTSDEDTSWLTAYLPSWPKIIYVVDDPSSPLKVPKNKGREAMVYLTYIIDNYGRLPENIVFIHASRFAWHNDDPDYDALAVLRNFQFSYLEESGYVNLRCVWTIGCPNELRPFEDEVEGFQDNSTTKAVFKKSFEELLPESPVPVLVAVSCCSQFAVTRRTVHTRPKEDYIRFRKWLLDTPLEDARSGRIMEFLWHILFGRGPAHCPPPGECYCKVFGLCSLTCNKEDSCEGRYTLPPYSNLPQGWPRIGWQGEDRPFSGPLP